MKGRAPYDLDVGFVHAPGAIRTAELTAYPLMQHWRIAFDPAPDRDVVNGKAPLRHDLLQIALGEGISQVPRNAEEDDHVFEVPSAEQRDSICGRHPEAYHLVPNPAL